MKSNPVVGGDSGRRGLPGQAWLRFWGVRGSIATPGPTTLKYGGNTSCVEVRVGDEIVILDAGTGLRLLGLELTNEFGDRPLAATLLLTHTHWDHIQGLPFFLPVYKPNNRLRILGYEGARNGLETILTGQMESPFFPIGLREVPGAIKIDELKETNFKIGEIEVSTCVANHPGFCVGYRLSTKSGSVAFFPDNELCYQHANSASARQRQDDPHADKMNEFVGRIAEFVRGVDVLIMDAQYDSVEYQQHIGWGHGCLDDVVALGLEAKVGRLFLFHHDPNHDDAKIDAMTAHARSLVQKAGATMEIEAAREGATLTLE